MFLKIIFMQFWFCFISFFRPHTSKRRAADAADAERRARDAETRQHTLDQRRTRIQHETARFKQALSAHTTPATANTRSHPPPRGAGVEHGTALNHEDMLRQALSVVQRGASQGIEARDDSSQSDHDSLEEAHQHAHHQQHHFEQQHNINYADSIASLSSSSSSSLHPDNARIQFRNVASALEHVARDHDRHLPAPTHHAVCWRQLDHPSLGSYTLQSAATRPPRTPTDADIQQLWRDVQHHPADRHVLHDDVMFTCEA